MKQLFTILLLIVISSTIGVNDMQSQKIKTSDCGCYFDSIINKWIYVGYDIPPRLPDGKDIMDIVHRINVPLTNYDENGEYIYITPITIFLIIDSNGQVLLYRVSEKSRKDYTAFEKIVIKAFETEMQWIPAQCAGMNVATRHYIPLNINFKKRTN